MSNEHKNTVYFNLKDPVGKGLPSLQRKPQCGSVEQWVGVPHVMDDATTGKIPADRLGAVKSAGTAMGTY